MNTLQMIQNFILVVEQGSITAAANKQSLTSAAVSKRLQQLEQHLGTSLLTRNTRRLALTEAGEYYYHHNQGLLAELERIDKHVQDMQQVLKGQLRINMPVTYGKNRLTPLLVKFLRLHPDIKIISQHEDTFTDASSGEFDVVIRIGQLEDSDLVARKLEDIATILVASPSYIKEHGLPQHPHDLQNHNCLQYTHADELNFMNFYNTEGRRERVKIRSNFQCNNGENLMVGASEGLGITWLPDFYFTSEIEDGSLVRLLPDYKFPSISAYAVYPSKRYLPEKTRSLIDFLIQNLNHDTLQ